MKTNARLPVIQNNNRQIAFSGRNNYSPFAQMILDDLIAFSKNALNRPMKIRPKTIENAKDWTEFVVKNLKTIVDTLFYERIYPNQTTEYEPKENGIDNLYILLIKNNIIE